MALASPFDRRKEGSQVTTINRHLLPEAEYGEFVDEAMRRSDAVDLHEGSECVPGGMPEKWEDDHEAKEQRPSSQHDIARD